MQKIISWIKSNKLSSILILVLAYLVFTGINIPMQTGSKDAYYPESYNEPMGYSEGYSRTATPQPDAINRKVITNANVSLLVKDVQKTTDDIETQVINKKGYIVNTDIQRPEEGATGSITVRVPSTELKDMLKFLRGLAVKVVSESIDGSDITDQYMDIQARLDILNRNKAVYVGIMERATGVTEIMQVQQQIFALQDQLDNLEGQIRYLDASSSTSLISINLSTDELSLPYAPDNAWRPGVVFKQAARALLGTLRDAGSSVIWVAVYSVVWIPLLVVVLLARKIYLKKHRQL